MVEIVGTLKKKQALIDKAEQEGKEVPKEEIEKFETDSIIEM